MIHPKIEDGDIMLAAHNHLDFTQYMQDEKELDETLQTIGISFKQVQGVITPTLLHRKAELEDFSVPREQIYAGGMLEGMTLGIKIAYRAAERAEKMREELAQDLEGGPGE